LIGSDAPIPVGMGPIGSGKESVVRSRIAGVALAAASVFSMALGLVAASGFIDSAKRWLA